MLLSACNCDTSCMVIVERNSIFRLRIRWTKILHGFGRFQQQTFVKIFLEILFRFYPFIKSACYVLQSQLQSFTDYCHQNTVSFKNRNKETKEPTRRRSVFASRRRSVLHLHVLVSVNSASVLWQYT